MRLQLDVIGIFRFLIVAAEGATVAALLEQAQREFRATYELAAGPRFVRLTNERQEEVAGGALLGETFADGARAFAVPDPGFCEQLKKAPWAIVGVEEQEFEVRLELLRRVFGDEANVAVLRACLVRASGQLSRAVAVASYVRPDVLGTSKKLIFVRPRQDK